MRGETWNHNIHYHGIVLRSLPSPCRRVLDVGCGQGLLARRLVRYCDEVIAIDSDHEALTRAEADGGVEPRVRFIEGDVMTRPFALESFDAITLVATLHHLPLKLALQRFRLLLKTGGVLAVVGLYRQQTFVDYVFAAAAIPISFVSRCLHGYADVGAPQKNPKETLHDIRQECSASLPGAVLKRRLLFRYSLVWTKP